MVYAIAHIRGGGEMGRPWYEDSGKYLTKRNTFQGECTDSGVGPPAVKERPRYIGTRLEVMGNRGIICTEGRLPVQQTQVRLRDDGHFSLGVPCGEKTES